MCLVTQLCPPLCHPIGCSPWASSVHGISQARTLEWVTISFSRGSSWPRDWTCFSCIGRQILYPCATREAHLRWAETVVNPGIEWKTLALLCSQMLIGFNIRKIMGTFTALLGSPNQPVKRQKKATTRGNITSYIVTVSCFFWCCPLKCLRWFFSCPSKYLSISAEFISVSSGHIVGTVSVILWFII